MGDITVREATSDADIQAWAAVKRAALPNDSAWTVEEFRARMEPTRRAAVAEHEGQIVGSSLGGRSDATGRSFASPWVLPDARRQGVGTALLNDLLDFIAPLGYELVSAYVEDSESVHFAERFGFVESDRQVEQVIALDALDAPIVLAPLPEGIELTTIAERPELLEAAYPLATIGFSDMALEAAATFPLDHWLAEESTLPGGSFIALHDGEIVGYSGLSAHDNEATAEDGLTVVAREWRGRGLSIALKQRELEWARTHGIREVITWTQKGNDAMRRANEKLGYEYRDVAITMTASVAALRPSR